jgi:hypothetical protein
VTLTFISPFEYKGHSLYAARVESQGITPRWRAYMDNELLHEWAVKSGESEDDVKMRLRTEAEAKMQSR